VRTNAQAAHDGIDPGPDDPEPGPQQQQIDRVSRGELPHAESVIARDTGGSRVQPRQQHHRQASTATADKEPQQATNGGDRCEPSGRLLGCDAPSSR